MFMKYTKILSMIYYFSPSVINATLFYDFIKGFMCDLDFCTQFTEKITHSYYSID